MTRPLSFSSLRFSLVLNHSAIFHSAHKIGCSAMFGALDVVNIGGVFSMGAFLPFLCAFSDGFINPFHSAWEGLVFIPKLRKIATFFNQ